MKEIHQMKIYQKHTKDSQEMSKFNQQKEIHKEIIISACPRDPNKYNCFLIRKRFKDFN